MRQVVQARYSSGSYVPRFVFSLIIMAAVVRLAIQDSREWANSIESFLALIGCRAGCFDAVVIEELLVFRRFGFGGLDHRFWNVAAELPTGIAAVGATLVSLAVVIPRIQAAW